MYKAVYKTKDERINYWVTESENSYYIESEICGGRFHEKVCLGNCKEDGAEKAAKLFAKKAVHPVHIEDIICDMRF